MTSNAVLNMACITPAPNVVEVAIFDCSVAIDEGFIVKCGGV